MARAAHTGSTAAHTSDIGLPPHAPPANHGKTTAAWVTTYLMILTGAVSTVGFILGSAVLAIAGGIGMVVSLVIGRILRSMGMGQK